MWTWMRQKCKEGFGDAVKSLFKNVFTWILVVILTGFGAFLLFVRKLLDNELTFTLTVRQVICIVLGFTVAVVVLHLIIYLLRRRRTPANYCSDVIDDIIWQWVMERRQTGFVATYLIPLCPKDECQIELRVSYYANDENRVRTLLECPRGDTLLDRPGHPDSMYKSLRTEIERRIRTGEYAKARARIKAHKKSLRS